MGKRYKERRQKNGRESIQKFRISELTNGIDYFPYAKVMAMLRNETEDKNFKKEKTKG